MERWERMQCLVNGVLGHEQYAVNRVVQTLDEWGRTGIVLTSERESVIRDLKQVIKAARIEDTILEEVPRGEHRANGEVEGPIGGAKGLRRGEGRVAEAFTS